jgi:hypothetical protein
MSSEIPQVDFTQFKAREKKSPVVKSKIAANSVRWWMADDKILA